MPDAITFTLLTTATESRCRYGPDHVVESDSDLRSLVRGIRNSGVYQLSWPTLRRAFFRHLRPPDTQLLLTLWTNIRAS